MIIKNQTRKYCNCNKYFIIIVFGIIAFINSELAWKELSQDSKDLILIGINYSNKILLIISILFLITQIPLSKVYSKIINKVFGLIIICLNKIFKKNFKYDIDSTNFYYISTLSNVGYFLFIFTLILFVSII